MKLTDKKYFSISEVSNITGVPQHKLRYLEKSNSIAVFQIRGRRYYTRADIDSIKEKFNIKYDEKCNNILQKIDSLMSKFITLKDQLSS